MKEPCGPWYTIEYARSRPAASYDLFSRAESTQILTTNKQLHSNSYIVVILFYLYSAFTKLQHFCVSVNEDFTPDW